jgi:hypothetical protein
MCVPRATCLWQTHHVCLCCITHSQTQTAACKTTWLPPLVLTYGLKAIAALVTMTDSLIERDLSLCLRVSITATYQQFHDDGFDSFSHHVASNNRALLLHYRTNIRANALSNCSAYGRVRVHLMSSHRTEPHSQKSSFGTLVNIARAHQRNIAACGGGPLHCSLRDRPVTSRTRACNR